MKSKILTSLSVIILIGALITACEKEKDNEKKFESTGIIQGADLTMTPCSGGWIIDFEEDEENYRFYSLPDGSGIDLATSTFPVKIKLNLYDEWNI